MNQTPLLAVSPCGWACSWNTLSWGLCVGGKVQTHPHVAAEQGLTPEHCVVVHILLGKCQRRPNIIDLSVCEEFLPSSRQIYKE